MTPFTQAIYSKTVSALDEIMDEMTECAADEPDAQAWLLDFIQNHYFPVWRRMRSLPATPGPEQAG